MNARHTAKSILLDHDVPSDVIRIALDLHADELKERLRERLPMGYKHWADVYLDSSEEGEVECSHEGLECQWSRCQEKKPPEVSE